MRSLLFIAAVVLLAPLFLSGCKEPETVVEVKPVEKDPGWPTIATQDAAVQFDLEETHYHIRKARYTDPGSYGSGAEMPIALGYAQRAYEMQPDNDSAMTAVDHLVLENGAHFDVPYTYTPRCMWCGYAMPKSISRWPMQGGQKVVECPSCGARDPFPTGLVIKCPYCNDVVAGTAPSGQHCPTCGRAWSSLQHVCSNCGLEVGILARQSERCPRCKVKWNFDAPFANWPTRARAPVQFTGSGEGVPCAGYSAVTGWPCPNKTTRKPGADGKAYCWIHRHQAERDAVTSAAPAAQPAQTGPGQPPTGPPTGPPKAKAGKTTPAPPEEGAESAPKKSDEGGGGLKKKEPTGD